MSQDELVAMLRHAAEHFGLHHIAAINEIRSLTRITSDEEFRAKTIEILEAVLQVDEEIDEVAEAVAR